MNIWKIIYLKCRERYEGMTDYCSYTHNLSSCEIKAWKKFTLYFQNWLSYVYNCDDQSCLHIFLCSSNIWPFIYQYPLVFFTIYRYITNSQCDQLPDGLIAQLVEHCTGIARSWVWIPFRPEFLSGFNSQLLKLCV